MRFLPLLLACAFTSSRAAAEDLCGRKASQWATRAWLSTVSYTDPCEAWKRARELAVEEHDSRGLALIPACETSALWERFRDAVLAHLESDPDNPAALRAASVLRRSGLRFAAQDLQIDSGITTVAQYLPLGRVIELDYRVFEKYWTYRFPEFPDDESLRRAADRYSPWLVHELAHARQYLEMEGRFWNSYAEDELIPYAEQAAYLMYRLRREPDAFGMRCIDEQFAGRLGSPWTARGWWLVPLEPGDALRAQALVEDVRAYCAADRTGTNSWYLVRSFAGGFQLLESSARAMPSFGLEGESIFALPPEHLRRSRDGLASRRRAVEACRALAREKGYERYLDADLAVLDAKSAFYSSESGLAELRRRQRDAMRQLEENLRSLGVPAGGRPGAREQ